jgi:hypothetical protein
VVTGELDRWANEPMVATAVSRFICPASDHLANHWLTLYQFSRRRSLQSCKIFQHHNDSTCAHKNQKTWPDKKGANNKWCHFHLHHKVEHCKAHRIQWDNIERMSEKYHLSINKKSFLFNTMIRRSPACLRKSNKKSITYQKNSQIVFLGLTIP